MDTRTNKPKGYAPTVPGDCLCSPVCELLLCIPGDRAGKDNMAHGHGRNAEMLHSPTEISQIRDSRNTIDF